MIMNDYNNILGGSFPANKDQYVIVGHSGAETGPFRANQSVVLVVIKGA